MDLSPDCDNGPAIRIEDTGSRKAETRMRASAASSGNLLSTESTAEVTSASACSISVPLLNSSEKIAAFSLADANTESTFSRKRTSGSSTCTIASSTEAAGASCQVTLTVIRSRTKSGKNWVRRLKKAHTPAAIISIIKMLAAVPWRAKTAMKPLSTSASRMTSGRSGR